MPGFCSLRRFVAEQTVADRFDFIGTDVLIENGCALALRVDQGLDHVDALQRASDLLHQLVSRAAQFRPGFGDGWRRRLRDMLQGRLQIVEAATGGGHDGANGQAAQVPLQDLDGDVDTAGRSGIGHGERHHGWQLHFHQLLQQVKPLVEVGRIQHDQESIRPGRLVHASQNDVHGDALVRGKAAQAVNARQVHQFQGTGAELRDS